MEENKDLPFPKDSNKGNIFPEPESKPVETESGDELAPTIAKESVLTKTSIHRMAELKAITIIKEGMISPLKSYLKVKALLEYYGELGKKLNAVATEEAEGYAKGERTIMGIEFDIAASARKFDYGEDADLKEINKELDKCKEAQGKRQEYLKGLKKETPDEETGEMIMPARHLSGGKDILKVTIKK